MYPSSFALLLWLKVSQPQHVHSLVGYLPSRYKLFGYSKILVAVKVGSHARRSNYKRIIQKKVTKMWMNIIQALGSSSPVERVATFVKSMIQKQILKQYCLDREDILILYWIMISKQTDNNWISLGGQFNTEERAHGTIHMIFAQTPHEYLAHVHVSSFAHRNTKILHRGVSKTT